jgi:hypothetical protein
MAINPQARLAFLSFSSFAKESSVAQGPAPNEINLSAEWLEYL